MTNGLICSMILRIFCTLQFPSYNIAHPPALGSFPGNNLCCIILTHWKPLHNINCAHLRRYRPIVEIQWYRTQILTNFIGTGTLDHCTFDQYNW